jgi:hypothetical protein
MKNLLQNHLLILIISTIFLQAAPIKEVQFGAYYTKIQSGEAFEKYSRTSEHADIIVKMKSLNGKIVFWRGTSYLPYWETGSGKKSFDALVPRSGDGSTTMPDKVNMYSHAEIISSDDTLVVIHWRYEPDFSGTNPHKNVSSLDFVDEYFYIYSEGTIVRTVKKGTPKIDDWNDPFNVTTQTLQLTNIGITTISLIPARTTSIPSPVITPNPIKGPPAAEPSAWWKFDEGKGETTEEAKSLTKCAIAGHKALWKKGISGTALQFDGYTSLVSLPSSKAPVISDGITLEAWIAIADYPWNWTPIIQQGVDYGYYLGVDGRGYPGFRVYAGGKYEALTIPSVEPYQNNLPMYRWSHVAGSFDKNSGMMRLYVDGKEVASKKISTSPIQINNDSVKIGMGKELTPLDPVRTFTYPSKYTFDGLIDEVRIYNKALTGTEITSSFTAYNPGSTIVNAPDMEKRDFPHEGTNNKFGARYTNLKYYETWDNMWRFGKHPDVVVGFESQPTRFVFWRGTSYVPMIANEKNQWYSNEFNETWTAPGGAGTMEPMSDKENFHSHVRVIENTPARVVIHWRCPPVDVFHFNAYHNNTTGWGDWFDWYYYIYPDGVAAKKMRLWSSGTLDHEWHESMVVMAHGQHPETILEKQPTLTLVDANGGSNSYDWLSGPPNNISFNGKVVQVIHYTGDYDPFTITEITGGTSFNKEVRKWYSIFPSWNHWPTAQILSDGRYASFSDRAAHSSTTNLLFKDTRKVTGDAPFQERLMLEGMFKGTPASLVPLAKSWLKPASLDQIKGGTSSGYDKNQRAYQINVLADTLSFRLNGSTESPIVNPAFVIRNWSSDKDKINVTINGSPLVDGKTLFQGVIIDTNGTWTNVVYLDHKSTSSAAIECTKTVTSITHRQFSDISKSVNTPFVNFGSDEIIQYRSFTDGLLTFKLLTLNGKLIGSSMQQGCSNSVSHFKWDLFKTTKPGLYILQMHDKQHILPLKVLKK